MASKRKRRTRKRIKLSRGFWFALWIVAAFASLSVGLTTSNLTQIRVVRIRSDDVSDRTRLESIARSYQSVPQAQIRAYVVEKRVETPRSVLRSDYFGNIFGSASINVTYREPVAKLLGRESYGVDEEGVIFPSRRAGELNVSIAPTPQEIGSILCIADPSRLRELARVAGKVQLLGKKHTLRLYSDSLGRLCFNIDGSLTVVLGTEARLNRKVEVVQEALASMRELAANARTINVVEPDQPVYEEK